MTCQPPLSSKPASKLSHLAITASWLLLAVFFVPITSARAETIAAPGFMKAGKWTIAPIDRGDGDSRMFCSAKTSYGTTLSFVFARDSGGGQSLGFEFPQKSFAAGATIPILLAVGDTQYPLNALAATNKVLLIGITRHSEIEKALLQGRPMLLQVSDKAYLMSLSGFVASLDQVDHCLSALESGEKFTPVKVEPDNKSEQLQTITPAVDREVSRLRSNVTPEEMESFNPAVAAQNAVLLDEIRRLKRENQRLLIEKQAAESQLLATTVDTAAGDSHQVSDVSAPPEKNMPVIAPYIVRADKEILWPPSKTFADMVAIYMTTEAARCPADFAQTPGAQYKTPDDMPVQELEIACLGLPKTKDSDSLPGDYAAALLFVGTKGKINVIVHQGPAGMIEQALQSRAAALPALGIQKP